MYSFLDILSSDEDEIDDQGQDYLDNLSRKANTAVPPHGMNVTATINDIDDNSDDDDSEFEPTEETVLETYTTPLDDEDCEVDEYQAFKQVMTGKVISFLIFQYIFLFMFQLFKVKILIGIMHSLQISQKLK